MMDSTRVLARPSTGLPACPMFPPLSTAAFSRMLRVRGKSERRWYTRSAVLLIRYAACAWRFQRFIAWVDIV